MQVGKRLSLEIRDWGLDSALCARLALSPSHGQQGSGVRWLAWSLTVPIVSSGHAERGGTAPSGGTRCRPCGCARAGRDAGPGSPSPRGQDSADSVVADSD